MTDAYRIRSAETWDAARDAYLAGAAAEDVCRRHDLGLSAFRARARRHGWRRADQPDPEPQGDDLDAYAGADLDELVDLAWRRMAQAIDLGRATEALRWRRLHASLLELVDDEPAPEASPAAPPRPPAASRPADVHDVHSNFSEAATLTRAERRRLAREARRRS